MIRVGVVLAGGQSRRMGQDKALMRFRDERLLDRALGKLGCQVDVLLLNRADRPDDIDDSVTLISDRHTGSQGPLAGVHAALAFMAEQGMDNAALFTVPVDSPFIPMDLVSRLNQADQPVAFATSQDQRHPVFARWPANALPTIDAALRQGDRKIDRVATALGFEDVAWELATDRSGRLVDPFANVNTVDEFNALSASH